MTVTLETGVQFGTGGHHFSRDEDRGHNVIPPGETVETTEGHHQERLVFL